MDLSAFRAWAEIDLDALLYNHQMIRQSLSPDVWICVVVKADAYGHGALRISRALEGKCEYFAVAMAQEAYELRRGGIKTPILVLGLLPRSQYKGAVINDLTVTVAQEEDALALEETARSLEKRVKVHLALDTGMGRIGFLPNEESLERILRISRLPHLEIEGIFTHFACADEPQNNFSRVQQELFSRFVRQLESRGLSIAIKHLYNSVAICTMNDPGGMVREGLVLYGVSPLSKEGAKGAFRPVMTFKSRVIQVKTVPANTPISYGSSYRTAKESRIATVSVGYGDGIPRLLSNKGQVLIHGKRVPIVGKVCMDQLMVDVSDLTQVALEDEVILFGGDSVESIGAQDVMELCGGIAYELLCGVNRRVPRVYLQGGRIESIANILPEFEE